MRWRGWSDRWGVFGVKQTVDSDRMDGETSESLWSPVALMSRGARLEDGGAANHECGDDRGDRAWGAHQHVPRLLSRITSPSWSWWRLWRSFRPLTPWHIPTWSSTTPLHWIGKTATFTIHVIRMTCCRHFTGLILCWCVESHVQFWVPLHILSWHSALITFISRHNVLKGLYTLDV